VRNNFACKYNFNKVRFGFHGLLDSFCLCENRGGNRDNSNRLFLLAGIDKIYKGVWSKSHYCYVYKQGFVPLWKSFAYNRFVIWLCLFGL